jgi:hypothetical protein
VRQGDPKRVRVALDRRAEQVLPEVERDGPLLEPTDGGRRDERGEIAKAGDERQDPGDGRDRRVRRGAAGGRGGPRSGNQDRDREGDRRCGRDAQPRPGVADPMPSGPEEQEGRDRLDREEVGDDEQRDRRVAARPDPDPDHRRAEPGQ